MIDRVMAEALAQVPLENALGWLHQVCRYDRYQASDGILEAAAFVAEIAQQAGLRDIGVSTSPADGTARWWTFEAPVGWTPVAARLEVPGVGGWVLDHGRDPFALATYSAPAPARALPLAAMADDVHGAVVVVPGAVYRTRDVVADLHARGAAGFVTDGPARELAGRWWRGRIELRPGSGLFAFSLTPHELARLVARTGLTGADAADPAAGDGPDRRPLVVAAVDVRPGAAMPVVSGVLAGDVDEEVWVTAHLCHPGPGANDNGSGVAAALAVASAVVRSTGHPSRTVRWVWAPEFVGSVAALHGHLAAGGRPPAAVLNVDMVGGDVGVRGGEVVLERPPEHAAGLLVPVAEAVLAEVTRRVDGVAPWRSSPYLGYSDHAVFADPALPTSAVQLCQVGDRVNHSAGDTADTISPVELTRAIATTTAVVRLLADDRARPASEELDALVSRWVDGERADVERTAARAEADGHRAWADGLRRHAADAAARVIASSARSRDGLVVGPCPAGPGAPAPGGGRGEDAVLTRHWDGPVNLRALTDAMSPGVRRRVDAMVRADKAVLATMANLALQVDGRRPVGQVVAEASYALRQVLPAALTEGLVEAMLDSGWVGTCPS